MTCWNCRANVPMAPFCRNCGAALPDPETRRAAITTRLGEIENERRVLESQLARVNGSTPAGTQTVISSPTSTAGVGSPEPIQPAATATVTPTTPATPSRISQLSPSLLVTLIGVVVLGVASLVSAKEHEPLISLSHSTRISVLIVELIIATVATLLLASRRAMLADAFGSLTWAAGLSLALLATVNVDTGLIADSWTYSIPFIVAIPILALTRLKLPITRFVSFGTLGYGVWHLALFGLKDSAVEFLPMFRVALVMVLVSLVCATILWVAHSARSDEWNEAEKILAFIGIAFVYSTTLFADLPTVHDISSSILATIGLLSMAVPFVTAAVALQRRGSSDALLGSQAYFVVAGLLTLNTVTALALGHSVEFISHDIFSGSRTATLWFPVILTIAAFGTAVIAMRTAWKVAGWILTAIALVPSVGAVAASLRWEFLGYLGSDRTTTAISENFYSFGSSIGWFGRGVTIAHVPSVVVALSGLSVATALLVAGRSMRTTRGSRAMRQAGFVALTATTLATVLRYTPALSAPHIVAVTLAVLAVGAFFASRLWNDEAPVDEWLPSLFMVGAIASAGVVRSHHTISVTLTTHVSGLLTTVLVGTSLLGLLSAYRRSATWRAQAGLALQGPVLLVVQYGHHPHHLAWSVGMVAAGVVALYVSLTTFANPERKFIASGAAVPASLFLLSQLATFYDRQHYFRVDVTVLAVLATIVAARRREPRIPTAVLVGGSAVAGLAWADNFQRIDHFAFWIIGGAVLLLGLLRGVRNDDSWTSLAPGLVFGFIPGVVSVTSEGSLAARSGVLILAIAVTVVGYITRRDAPVEIGSVAAALTLTIESPTSTTWTVLTVALAVLWFLVGTQRRFPSVQITPRAGLITALAGVAMWLDSLSYQIVHLHNSRVLEIVLVGLVTVAAARRLSWTFDGMHFLAASGLVGVAWTSSFHSIPGAGVWIGVGGALLLALSLGVDTPTHRSWIEWGPSLLFVMIPANYSALSGSVVSAAVTILVAVALVIIAIAQRKRAVFDVAIATFAILSAARLSQVVSDKSRWIVAVVVGVALIGNGLWRETRSARGHRQDDEASTSWYRSLT